jgi:BMFP domain-containing protein YqiC
MDDVGLQAIGREFVRLTTVAEQMYVENQALKARVAELEAEKAKSDGP